MKNAELLRSIGWSEDLIRAVSERSSLVAASAPTLVITGQTPGRARATSTLHFSSESVGSVSSQTVGAPEASS